MATASAKTFGVGDTVYVNYDFSGALNWDPATRVVSKIDFTAALNVATIYFSSGNNIVDSDASSTVYVAEATAAAAQATLIIANAASVIATDTTTSIVSTAGNTSTTLGRIG